MALLEDIRFPQDLRRLNREDLPQVAAELRAEVVRACSIAGGHLASSKAMIVPLLPRPPSLPP